MGPWGPSLDTPLCRQLDEPNEEEGTEDTMEKGLWGMLLMLERFIQAPAALDPLGNRVWI